jgi:hypothetical protein
MSCMCPYHQLLFHLTYFRETCYKRHTKEAALPLNSFQFLASNYVTLSGTAVRYSVPMASVLSRKDTSEILYSH